jgi:hypothetical protein
MNPSSQFRAKAIVIATADSVGATPIIMVTASA